MKSQLNPDSLFYTLLDAKGYTYLSSDETISEHILKTPIEHLKLCVQSYNCLKRAGVDTLEDLRRFIQEDQLFKVRNLSVVHYREVIDHYCQFLKEKSSNHLELHFMQKKSPITFIYDKNQYDLYCITADVLKDLFPNKEEIF